MGVPRLAPFIFNHFPKCRYNSSFRKKFNVECLYIDANAVLHKSTQRTFNYGDGKMFIDPYEGKSLVEREVLCFKNFIDDLQTIIHIADPTVMVYIALDGCAPIAKQSQQRQRRFVSARENGGDIPGKFNPNCITPGTEFTKRLNVFLETTGIPSLKVRRGVGVVFNSCFINGEGEHKIMDYIRDRARVDKIFRNELSHTLFGPDGDLIMLCMALPVAKSFLLRDGRDVFTYDFLDMSAIRRELKTVLYPNSVSVHTRRLRGEWLNMCEFVFAGFFVGNDFLPKVNMFFHLEDGLDMMLRTIDGLAINNKFIVNDDAEFSLNSSVVKVFIHALSLAEEHFISEQQFIHPPSEKFINTILVKNVNVDTRRLNFKNYRRDYYLAKFKFDIACEDGILQLEEVCKGYWRMIVWVYVYYIHGIKRCGWNELYRFHYPPLMCDLSWYLSSRISDVNVVFEHTSSTKFISPDIQLLCVIPPTSANLVPSEYKHLLSGDMDFEVDYEGKSKEYQGVALIPFADVNYIFSQIDQKTNQKLETEKYYLKI